MKKELMEELVYLYFRFTSFEMMGDGYFENIESKFIFLNFFFINFNNLMIL